MQTVACTTYLVQPGFFDIFFPTDFHQLRDLYSLIMSPSLGGVEDPVRKLTVSEHSEFLAKYGEVESVTLKDGSNPLLEFYQNAQFIS